ncbi:MAG: hypothetical protein D6820_15605, partial [Lentisphaerae bacterium]
MNCLVTTIGTTWSIIPEVLGFTNPELLDLYRHCGQSAHYARLRQSYNIQPVDCIHIVTTLNQKLVAPALAKLRRWFEPFAAGLELYIYQREGVVDLTSAGECRQMTDLIWRTVLHARQQCGPDGQLLLCLAGGRKTMSADVQEAAHIFGCHAMLHVVDADQERASHLNKFEEGITLLQGPLPPEYAEATVPI